jgi:hypothetical protein
MYRTTGREAYRAARELVRHRDDYDAAVAAFRWPDIGDRSSPVRWRGRCPLLATTTPGTWRAATPTATSPTSAANQISRRTDSIATSSCQVMRLSF